MIKRFILWLKGSHVKRSQAILGQFSDMQKELHSVNRDIVAQHLRVKEKQLKLQEEEKSLQETLAKNAVVAENINKLLGN